MENREDLEQIAKKYCWLAQRKQEFERILNDPKQNLPEGYRNKLRNAITADKMVMHDCEKWLDQDIEVKNELRNTLKEHGIILSY